MQALHGHTAWRGQNAVSVFCISGAAWDGASVLILSRVEFPALTRQYTPIQEYRQPEGLSTFASVLHLERLRLMPTLVHSSFDLVWPRLRSWVMVRAIGGDETPKPPRDQMFLQSERPATPDR